MNSQQLRELGDLCLHAATEAGALVHGAYRSRPSTDEKQGFADIVTEFDLRSEELIRGLLQATGIAIVGEEGGASPGSGGGGGAEGLAFHIDPIDGTTNFAHGHPFYCVSIGLLGPEGPLLGVVVAPALSTSWVGGPGVGATRNGVACRVTGTTKLAQSLVATGFHPGQRELDAQHNVTNFSRVLGKVRGIRRCGSAALDLVLTADGTYDGYWEMALNSWDTVGGAAIALGAGARVTNLRGGPVDLAAGYLCVTNGLIHDELLSLFEDADPRQRVEKPTRTG